jgi:Tol biopolymer transport system component
VWLPWTAAAAAIALAAIAWLVLRPAARPDDPLAGATFTRLTDFPGNEFGAALSEDGKFVVFMSDRDGPNDLWVGQVGSNQFQNLTHGTFSPNTRGQRPGGFTFDGSEIWLAGPPPPTSRMALMPILGGSPRSFLPDQTVNASWSKDGKRMVYNVNTPGDPMFMADGDGSNPQPLFAWPAVSRSIPYGRAICRSSCTAGPT